MATIIKLLKRQWFPIGAFVLTFAFLTWLLQPRPRESYSFETPEEYRLWDHGNSRSKTFSPSGRYVCFESQDEDDHVFIHVFDIHTKSWLFKNPCEYDRIQSQPMFTANDELIFSAFRKPDTVQLFYWKPGDAGPRMTHEYVYPIVHAEDIGPASSSTPGSPPPPPNDFPFDGLCSFDYRDLFDRTLSPDGLTWLVVVKQDRLIHLDFIDSRTGKRTARLEYPPIDLQKKGVRGYYVSFDPQSKYLLLRLWPETNQNEKEESDNWKVPTTLNWFEVPSGKMVLSKTIRTELLPKGRLLWMDLKQLTFLGYSNDLPVLQILNLDESYKQIAMTDTYREVLEETWPSGAIDSKFSLLRTSTSIHDSTDLESNLMMYSSSHILSAKHGTILGNPQLPGCSIGCRDVRTGRLLFTKAIELNRDYDNPHKRVGNGDVTALALPGPVFVLKHTTNDPEWVNKPESWRHKLGEWVTAFQYKPTSTFRIIDPHTGKQQSEMIVPQRNVLTQLSADKRSFSILGVTGDSEYQCLIYDYPFHRPWLLILSYAAGIPLSLLMLQILLRCLTKPVK